MLDSWNIIGLGGMGANAIRNLRAIKDERFLGAKFSCLTGYDKKNLIFKGKLDIKLRDKFPKDNNDIGADLITPNKLKICLSKRSNSLLIAGLGGITGSEAISSVADILESTSTRIICVVYFPFNFEGVKRQEKASQAYDALKKCDVKIVSFNNQDLFKVKDEKATFSDAFTFADKALQKFIKEQVNDDCLSDMSKYTTWDFATGKSEENG